MATKEHPNYWAVWAALAVLTLIEVFVAGFPWSKPLIIVVLLAMAIWKGIGVHFNEYRRYWLAEYTWAGRNVLARGSFEACLGAALREHDRGALGSCVVARPSTDEEAELCRAKGLIPEDEATAINAEWRDERFAEVSWALRYERNMGIPAVSLLVGSDSLADYKAKRDAALAERRAARQA